MSKFIALIRIQKSARENKYVHNSCVADHRFRKFNYLEIDTSSLALQGIWTFKVLFQVSVYD